MAGSRLATGGGVTREATVKGRSTVRDLVRAARVRFVEAGIDANEAALDAALLARHALGWDLARLLAHELELPPEGFPPVFDRLVARRAAREPISSLIGRREFRGLEFEVGPDVLAPRPETEIIIEEALATLKGRPTAPGVGQAFPGLSKVEGSLAGQPLLIDVGTGSGCLAICLAREFPDARIVATDISAAALTIAARNARRLGVAQRIDFVRTSLVDAVGGQAALVVSNPPYIPAADIERLDPEVRAWEPRQALDGGSDGLDVIRALVAAVPSVLASGGWFIMEFGFGQDQAVERLVRESPLELVRIANDLRQIPRTLVARATGRR
jgi:release factor glutamine methyltransferase